MKDYSYKVVGVTFDGRQDVLKSIFDAALADPQVRPEFEAAIRYDAEQKGGLAVDLGGQNIGYMSGDDKEAYYLIDDKIERIYVTLALNGVALVRARGALSVLQNPGASTPSKIKSAEQTAARLERDEKIYSAKVHFIAPEGALEEARERREDDLCAFYEAQESPSPEEKPKKGLFSRFRKKR